MKPNISLTFEVVVVFIVNMVIAVLISVLSGTGLRDNILISQSVGMSILAQTHLFQFCNGFTSKFRAAFSVTIILSSAALVGALVSGLLSYNDWSYYFRNQDQALIGIVLTTFVFGFSVSYFFSLLAIQRKKNNELHQEKMRRLSQEKLLIETQFQMLQAQIEPHFLFNTLSTVITLIDADPVRAKDLLERFTNYFRSSLQRTRSTFSTLKDEMNLVRTYLEIQKYRMGARLDYQIENLIEDDNFEFPPFLVQPLVENSIKHGLENKVGGGQIWIKISRDGDLLCIDVKDNGIGLKPLELQTSAGNTHYGLENIRKRIIGLYGPLAQLNLTVNEPSGFCAQIVLPLNVGSLVQSAAK